MFDNIKAEEDLEPTEETIVESELGTESEEKETPAESPTEEKTESKEEQPVSEDDKTPEEPKEDKEEEKVEEEPFHKHSRFKELVDQKNEYKQKLEEKDEAFGELNTKVDKLVEKLDKKETENLEFETQEEIADYLKGIPAKVKAELLAEQKAVEQAAINERQKNEQMINNQVQELKDNGKVFNEDDLFKFALEYKIPDLGKALELKEKFDQRSEEAKAEGEKIAKRKAESTPKSNTKKASSGDASIYVPGRDLDDIIEDAKSNIPK